MDNVGEQWAIHKLLRDQITNINKLYLSVFAPFFLARVNNEQSFPGHRLFPFSSTVTPRRIMAK